MPSVSKAATSGADRLNHAINRFMVASQAEARSNSEEGGTPENPNGRNKILCNDRGVYITQNLYQALLQLRKADSGYYWIDAICINQSDPTELARQVQMMGQIYSSAAQVTVWLGICPHIFSPGVANLVNMAREGLPDVPGNSNSQEFYFSRVGETSVWRLVLCILFIVTRRWFKRLWVLQELCLASKAVFILGEHQFQASDISVALSWVHSILHAWNASGMVMFAQGLTVFTDSLDKAFSLLNSRQNISQGQKVGLEDWFRLVKDREAKNSRDMVYGGLAVIRPETLIIHQDLKVNQEHPSRLPRFTSEEAPPLPPRPGAQSRDLHEASEASVLWPTLHADYKIGYSGFLENLAACLLSGPNPTHLLSLATRYRPSYLYDMSREISLVFSAVNTKKGSGLDIEIPSWYAIPWLDSSRVMKPLIWQSSTSLEYTSRMVNKPSISANGKSLFMDALQFDTIEQCVLFNLYGDLMHDVESACMLGGKSSLSAQHATAMTEYCKYFNTSPPFHLLELAISMNTHDHLGAQEPLEVFCDLLVAGAWDDDALESTPTANKKMIGFCQWLDDWVHYYLTEHQKAEQKAAKKSLVLQEFVKKRGNIMVKIQDDYWKLRTTYPDQPWSELDRETISEERKTLAAHFASTLQTAQTLRSVFRTKKGTLILAPAWAMEGDAVMLVKGGSVPYIFTSTDESLKRKIAYKEKQRGGIPENVFRERISHKEVQEWDINELQSQVGQRESYMLTGEAYIPGSIYKELSEQESRFSRIEII